MQAALAGLLAKGISYFNYAKKCVKHVTNIAASIGNISLLNTGEKLFGKFCMAR